ncbi:hypothetical protein SAMN04488133_1980 [Halobellus limi]|uniref:Uncharacterized protein n=1 Tax=Halobellus limi TaxID=699433 RepID=A0A1H5ZFD5_9EURY|nr:hypothetical protein SAMN04488133_1980 [Halobellus limi]
MHYRESLQLVIGEATRLNESGLLSDYDRRMVEESAKVLAEFLANAEQRTR